jgi:hypothetical protein
MKRSGHYDNLPANALAPTIWNLVQAWLITVRNTPTRRRRRATKAKA